MFYTPVPTDILEHPNVILFPMYSNFQVPSVRVVELLRLVSADIIPRTYFLTDKIQTDAKTKKKLDDLITSSVKATYGVQSVLCSVLSVRRDRTLICASYSKEISRSPNPSPEPPPSQRSVG